MSVNDEYHRWFFSARDAATDMPYGTLLLHRVAGNDQARFAEGERLMQIAFEAGYRAAAPSALL